MEVLPERIDAREEMDTTENTPPMGLDDISVAATPSGVSGLPENDIAGSVANGEGQIKDAEKIEHRNSPDKLCGSAVSKSGVVESSDFLSDLKTGSTAMDKNENRESVIKKNEKDESMIVRNGNGDHAETRIGDGGMVMENDEKSETPTRKNENEGTLMEKNTNERMDCDDPMNVDPDQPMNIDTEMDNSILDREQVDDDGSASRTPLEEEIGDFIDGIIDGFINKNSAAAVEESADKDLNDEHDMDTEVAEINSAQKFPPLSEIIQERLAALRDSACSPASYCSDTEFAENVECVDEMAPGDRSQTRPDSPYSDCSDVEFSLMRYHFKADLELKDTSRPHPCFKEQRPVRSISPDSYCSDDEFGRDRSVSPSRGKYLAVLVRKLDDVHYRKPRVGCHFQCMFCARSFRREKEAERHERFHRTGGLETCRLCNEAFKPTMYLKHMLNVHGVKTKDLKDDGLRVDIKVVTIGEEEEAKVDKEEAEVDSEEPEADIPEKKECPLCCKWFKNVLVHIAKKHRDSGRRSSESAKKKGRDKMTKNVEEEMGGGSDGEDEEVAESGGIRRSKGRKESREEKSDESEDERIESTATKRGRKSVTEKIGEKDVESDDDDNLADDDDDAEIGDDSDDNERDSKRSGKGRRSTGKVGKSRRVKASGPHTAKTVDSDVESEDHDDDDSEDDENTQVKAAKRTEKHRKSTETASNSKRPGPAKSKGVKSIVRGKSPKRPERMSSSPARSAQSEKPPPAKRSRKQSESSENSDSDSELPPLVVENDSKGKTDIEVNQSPCPICHVPFIRLRTHFSHAHSGENMEEWLAKAEKKKGVAAPAVAPLEKKTEDKLDKCPHCPGHYRNLGLHIILMHKDKSEKQASSTRSRRESGDSSCKSFGSRKRKRSPSSDRDGVKEVIPEKSKKRFIGPKSVLNKRMDKRIDNREKGNDSDTSRGKSTKPQNKVRETSECRICHVNFTNLAIHFSRKHPNEPMTLTTPKEKVGKPGPRSSKKQETRNDSPEKTRNDSPAKTRKDSPGKTRNGSSANSDDEIVLDSDQDEDKLLVLSSDDEKSEYSCKTCPLKFADEQSVKLHEQVHTDRRTCPMCRKAFRDLNSHLHNICGKDLIKIIGKGKKQATKTSADKPEKPTLYECGLCFVNFKELSKLKEHRRTCSSKPGPKSDKRARSKSESSDEQQASSSSDSDTSEESRPSSRRKQKPKSAREFICKVPRCDREFSSAALLKNHLETHTGERPFECNKCGIGFKAARFLKKHKLEVHAWMKQ